jgi:hypothetical protein
VQQVLGGARDKRGVGASGASAAAVDLDVGSTQGAPVTPGMTACRGEAANSNFQQLFYQAHAYGLGAPQLVHDAYFPSPPVFPAASGGIQTRMNENVREQVAQTLRDFGLEPRGWLRLIKNPTPVFSPCLTLGGFRCLSSPASPVRTQKLRMSTLGSF